MPKALSPRNQLILTVVAAALAAVGLVIGIVLLTEQHPGKIHAQPGKPPIPKTVPGPYGAAIRKAFVNWPHGSLVALQKLELDHPQSAPVQFYFGLALLWAGYTNDASEALETVKHKGVGYDTVWEVEADNILYPQYAPNVPVFQPIPLDSNRLLERGSQLQAEDKQHSAEKLYLQAAKLAPDDPQAQVAAAVGAFNKADLGASFGKLGPLTSRFPKSQFVHFYLGELLAWITKRDEAIAQFRKAVELGPTTELGKEAQTFVADVTTGGTGSSKR